MSFKQPRHDQHHIADTINDGRVIGLRYRQLGAQHEPRCPSSGGTNGDPDDARQALQDEQPVPTGWVEPAMPDVMEDVVVRPAQLPLQRIEFERDLIREHTQAGLTAARTPGRHGGRPKALDPCKAQIASGKGTFP